MPEVTTTVARVLEEDTPCRRCGYNLRGLLPTGLCPECGTAIAHSIIGNLLKQADADWLERLRFGTSLKLWNILLSILVGVAAAAILAAGLPPPLITIIGIAGGALGLCATILITSQEPRIALQEDPVTLRKALRTCAALAFVGGVISNANTTANWAIVMQIVGSALSLAGVFVAWGELLYFRRFADRIPDTKLVKSTTLLMWIVPFTVGLVILLALAAALTLTTTQGAGPPGPFGLGTMAVGIGGCFFAAFGLYLVLWYVRLLTKYRKAFRLAASESRASVILQPEA